MSGISISVDYRDLGRMGAKVTNFLATAGDTRPLLEGIGNALLLNIDLRFENSRGPDGTPWKKTARGGQILVDTARLRNSMDMDVSANAVAVGTNVIYASTHQKGATIKPVKARVLAFQINGKPVFAKSVTIPARPFIGIGDDDIKAMRGEVADFIRNAHREARG
ncbi:phage virion morphogenesis protein [Thalassospira sp. MCCC 1A01428]|uniref:phage virion morphogenesis protein n=1 Tax=Thalassospira sp. MCCC 1A01428 TaxID=1470575 RepID=UPI000A1FB935|nr:phage virion morphogenesis protein [Thalassospira sp. MCCC 1A01428]